MMSAIRTESDGANDLARVYLWGSRQRGQSVELDRGSRLELGVPISGARAVIVGVALHPEGLEAPSLGGVVRAISDGSGGAPARLVFDGRALAGLSRSEALSLADDLLASADDLVAEDGPAGDVGSVSRPGLEVVWRADGAVRKFVREGVRRLLPAPGR